MNEKRSLAILIGLAMVITGCSPASVASDQATLQGIWPTYYAKTIDDDLGPGYTAKWTALVPQFPSLPH